MIPTPEDTAQAREAFEDFERFCRESLTIRDKRGITRPLELSPSQRKLHSAFARARKMGRPVRILALKARQVYFSTGVAAEFFHRVPFAPGQRALIVAHEVKAARNIYDYFRQFHDGYKRFRDILLLPKVDTEAHAAGNIVYANKSRIEVATADNVNTGRSASIRFLQLSEYAFYRDAARLMTGLMQCVPDDPETAVVIESTANGIGGDFHRRWQEASAPGYDGEWICVFFAWWEHPEYRRAVADPLSFAKSLSREEQQLRETYNLTLEQLHWRRWAIANKCDGSKDRFKQEYPSSPQEAFLTSGSPRFSAEALARQRIIPEGLHGDLFEEQIGPKLSLMFREEPQGCMTLYKRPVPNRLYVVGVDLAQGIDPAAEKGAPPDPDWSVAEVFDRDTWEQVAKVRARLEPVPFAQYVDALLRWYNWGFVVPEVTGPGIAFMGELMRLDYPPSLIYRRKPRPDEEFRPDQQVTLHMLGWDTNSVSRVLLISRLDRALRDNSVILHDPNTVGEMQTFVIWPNGKPAGAAGCHDDEVIATALAVVGLETPPPDPRRLGLSPARAPLSQQAGAVRHYGRAAADRRGELVRLT